MKKAVLVSVFGIDKLSKEDAEISLNELINLCSTAGISCISRIIQKKNPPDPAFLIGKGKVFEIKETAQELKADLIVFDNFLKPIQQRNLEREIGKIVIDRTRVILDIFAMRAHSKEGKLQVERAQATYRLSNLSHSEIDLDSQTGGIGTRRGPGEKKLEDDKRKLRDQIARLDAEILKVRQRRDTQRKNRSKQDLPEAAIAGYTNAGKSTLLAALSKSAVYADDKLFATLDPLTRKIKLPNGRIILLTDTVGFINKLPHNLIAAFRSTMEEILRASCILHIIDGSSPDREKQKQTVLEVLKEIGAESIPVISVYNKSDKMDVFWRSALKAEGACIICAKTLEGTDEMLQKIAEIIEPKHLYKELTFDCRRQNLLNKIRSLSNIKSQIYEGNLIKISFECSNVSWEKIKQLLKQS